MNPTKIRDLIRNQAKVPFFNKINLWSIVDEAAVGMDFQMSAGLELSDHPDIFIGMAGRSLGSPETGAISRGWISA